MSVDVVGLRALAEAVAVEGPWAIWHDLDHQGFKTVGDAESYRQMLADGEAEDCNPVAHVYTDPDAEFIAAANPSVVLALLDEITTLREDVETLHRMEAEASRALADRDARIKAAVDLHAPMKIWESDRSYTLACRECKLEPHPCPTAQALSGPVVPVPQDNPEATHVGIMVRSRQSGRTREMIDALLARANELGVRVEIIEPEPTAEPTRDTLTLIARDVHLYDKGECAALSGPHARRIANAILAAFDVRPREQS